MCIYALLYPDGGVVPVEVADGGVILISVDLRNESDEISFIYNCWEGERRHGNGKKPMYGFQCVQGQFETRLACMRFFPCIALDTRGIFKCSAAMFA